jgi:hypothetical protein
MAERLTRQLVAEKAIVHEAPVLRAPTTVDRNFELPTALYAATAGLFLATVAVMAIGFASPGIVVPMGIIVVFIAMFFAVPAMWVRMKPDHPGRATSWARFQRDGIMTPFGRCSASAATVQVLILPALIFLWGLATVTIAALVR